MAEAFDAARLPTQEATRYSDLAVQIAAVVDGEPDRVARMATVSAMLAQAFARFLWCGFYRVDPAKRDELVIGPYQGALGCLRIAFGRGVCGTAAAERRTIVVPDVGAFPGHIACDARARSEIVVPVLDASGALIGVLDVDSAELAAFDDADAAGLGAIVRQAFGAA